MDNASLRWLLTLMVFLVWGCSETTPKDEDTTTTDVVETDSVGDAVADVADDVSSDGGPWLDGHGFDTVFEDVPEDVVEDTTPEPDVVACVDEDSDDYGDGCEAGPDCDDSDGSRYQLLTGYVDGDGDFYGAGEAQEICSGEELPAGHVAASLGDDCDDSDPQAYIGHDAYIDGDGDGYGVDPMTLCNQGEVPEGYVVDVLGEDCNDDLDVVYQWLDGYADTDGDGYTVGESKTLCCADSLFVGYVAESLGEDCDDEDSSVYQFGDAYVDTDLDGYGTGAAMTICMGDEVMSGYSDNDQDCAPDDGNIYQEESAYTDSDGDGFGSGDAQAVCAGETLPDGYADNDADCDDGKEENWQWLQGYVDGDGDGYGDGDLASVCAGETLPAGYAVQTDDCDDDDENAWQWLVGYADQDGDGHGTGDSENVCSGAELPGGYGVDNTDCNDSDLEAWDEASCMSDGDGDGIGVGDADTLCIGDEAPSGYAFATVDEDCDDTDAAHWYDCGLCVDDDGDDYGIDCDLGDDCNDGDLFVYPGGLEIPDDGVDGDCVDGDVTASSDWGIFVSSSGDDANAGTMEEPMETLGAAVEVAVSQGKVVFLSEGEYLVSNFSLEASIYGGYSPAIWQRDPSVWVSKIVSPDLFVVTVANDYPVVLSGVSVSGSYSAILSYTLYNTTEITIVDCVFTGGDAGNVTTLDNSGDLTLLNSVLSGGDCSANCYTIDNQASGVLFMRGNDVVGGTSGGGTTYAVRDKGETFGISNSFHGGYSNEQTRAYMAEGNTVLVLNEIHGGVSGGNAHGVWVNNGDVTLINNIIEGGEAATEGYGMRLSDGSVLALHNVISVSTAQTPYSVYVNSGFGILGNNILLTDATESGSAVVYCQSDDAELTLHHNDLWAMGDSSLLWTPAGAQTTEEGVNSCAGGCCTNVNSNISSDPLFLDAAGGDYHLSPSSACIGAGMDASMWYDLPIKDIDGELHPGSAGWDIGADAL